MTKEAALISFWSSFAIPAYEENTVPTDPEKRIGFFAEKKALGEIESEFPYLTYQMATDDFNHPVPLVASLWYRSYDWEDINAKGREIVDFVGSGKAYKIDGGVLYIKMGHPKAVNGGDPADDAIRRKILNITAEYMTTN